MVSFTIKITPELKNRLEAEAHLSGRSCSEIIRNTLGRRFAKKTKQQKTLTGYELAKDLCGIGHSGLGDLATNPKYLEGLGKWRK